MQQRFLLQILLLAQHVSGTTMPIIRSSKSVIQWLLSVVFRAVVFKLLVWCGAEGYVSGLQDAALKQCQLDATEVFIADLIACSTCFGHHYAHHQELKSIIQWLLQHPANRTHNPQLHTRPAT